MPDMITPVRSSKSWASGGDIVSLPTTARMGDDNGVEQDRQDDVECLHDHQEGARHVGTVYSNGSS